VLTHAPPAGQSAARDLSHLFLEAKEFIENGKEDEAITLFKKILETDPVGSSEEINKIKEQSIIALGEIYAKQHKSNELANLLKQLRPFFNTIPKAKTAKLVRSLIDYVANVPGVDNLLLEILKENIEWAKREKRTFLRQRLELKIAECYFKAKEYSQALQLVHKLLREVKKLDDKLLLVEINLLESYIQHALGHLPKARASLTAARTAANAIYCPPLLQAELDVQSGTLHADEKDFKTAYSYFYEAFENYTSLDNPRSFLCLKYMLLCKIMTNSSEDVTNLINGKLALKFASSELEAMRAIAASHAKRSLKDFKCVIEKYKKEIEEDPLIQRHLNELYDNLLEQNLIKIVEPFSCVQLEHVAELIELPIDLVEKKLSQMVLDKKLKGILDQGNGCLILFPEQPPDEVYPATLQTIENLSKVVDSLYSKAGKLT